MRRQIPLGGMLPGRDGGKDWRRFGMGGEKITGVAEFPRDATGNRERSDLRK